MFHQDCAVAANQLVLSLTKHDGQAHVTTSDVVNTFGGCKASVQAMGGTKMVHGSALLLSFAQIGARCQDGYFSYENGAIDGSLKGQAHWKRDDGKLPEAASRPKLKPRNMHIPPKNQPQRSYTVSARMGHDGSVYHLLRVSAHGVSELVPTSPKVKGMFIQRAHEFLDHNLQRGDAVDLTFGNAYPIEGATHVSLVSLGVSLRGGQKSWKEFIDSQNDSGKTFKELITDGIWNFIMNEYIAAYYDVVHANGDVFSFMIYGYNSVDSKVPSK